MQLETTVRLVGGLLFAIGAFFLAADPAFGGVSSSLLQRQVFMSSFGCLVGMLVSPHVTIRPMSWLTDRMRSLTLQELAAGTGGLLIALILSALMAVPMAALPHPFGSMLPFVATIVLSYLGIMLAASRRAEILGAFRHTREDTRTKTPETLPRVTPRAAVSESQGQMVLVDTSAIIDGRIADICQSGFMPANLVVPRFVLHEIQHIADSSDALRRNRGRRALEVLNRLQRDNNVNVSVREAEVDASSTVDAELITLAQRLKCGIITNDFNLNKVASLQGIKVLNINALANAVKTVVLPGESMTVRVIQEGKEPGQGVGYLDDGTMIVVEDGRRLLESTVDVTVTRVIQTAAGRMIFAQWRGEE